MIAGHFGFAALMKSRERQIPLWALMFATVWLDVVFIPLFMIGIERIETRPRTHGGYGNAIIHADYTHSLVGMLVLSAILSAIFLPFWGRRSAIVIGLVAASHWMLDLIVHRADMPLLPGHLGRLSRLGFGLWAFPMVSAALEAVLVLLGAGLYWRAARAVSIQAKQSPTVAATVAVLIAACGILTLCLELAA